MKFCNLCFSIQALLSAPNPDDPLSENIAKHWKSNEAEAVETGNFSFLFICLNLKNSVFFNKKNDIIILSVKPTAKEWTHMYASGA